MSLYSILFSKYTRQLIFYTLFISKISYSNSLRIGISPMCLSYISTFASFKHYYERNTYINAENAAFELRSSKVDEIMENLKGLTLLETSELIKKIEETFGVSAQVLPQGPLTLKPQAVAPDEPFKDEEEEEDPEKAARDRKKTHSVVIKEISKEKFIEAFRVLREFYSDKSAVEIKKIMDSVPYTVKTVNNRREADNLVKKLEMDGMTIVVE